MHFQKCENNWRKNYGSNHPRIAIINIRKGDLYNILGDYENGLLFGSEALQSLKDNNIKTPRYHRSIHNNLAISYESLGLYEKALLHYDEAKEIIIVTYGDSSIHYFNNQYFRAETYGHLDNAEASISILESVLHKII